MAKVTICSQSTHQTAAVPLTKAWWKKFISKELHSWKVRSPLPHALKLKGLWAFLHPLHFCYLCHHSAWCNWLKQHGWGHKQHKQCSILHLFTSYANSIISLFSAPGKHQHLDKEQPGRAWQDGGSLRGNFCLEKLIFRTECTHSSMVSGFISPSKSAWPVLLDSFLFWNSPQNMDTNKSIS